jgi:hypothetical protein
MEGVPVKTTDPKLAKFLGDERIRTLSDEELCRLIREFYRLPHPPKPADPQPAGVTVINPSLVEQVKGWWARLYNR